MDKRTRLLLLTHEFPHAQGDAAFIRNEIDALATEFDEVAVVSLKSPDAPLLPLPENVSYLGAAGTITRGRALRGLLNCRRLFRALASVFAELPSSVHEIRSDIIAALTGAWIAASPPIRAAFDFDGSIFIYSYWGVDIGYALPQLRNRADRIAVRVHRYDLDALTAGYRPIRRSVLGTADLVLTISRAGSAYVAKHLTFVPSDSVHLSHLGTLDPIVRSPQSLDETIRVVSCSSAIELKRLGLILDVLEALVQRGHRVQWVHFGDGPVLASIRQKASEVSASNPSFECDFRGYVPTEEIFEHYATSPVSLFINLSTIEGIPVSAMEAASFGISIVATDVGSTWELVGEHLGSGVLVSSEPSVCEVVDAVELIAAHPDEFDARRIWAAEFNAVENSRAAATLIAQSELRV